MKQRFALKAAFVALCLVCFAVFLTVSSSAKDAVGGDYEIRVARTPVTADNCADVLGDGTVSYDPTERILRIKNFQSADTDCSQLPNGLYYEDGRPVYACFSIISVAKEPIQVIIEGKCHFAGAVRVDNGTVSLKNAKVTFGEYASAFFDVSGGNLLIENSEITLSKSEYLTRVTSDREVVTAILAVNLEMADSTVTFEGGGESAYEYYDAFICTLKNCEIVDSTLVVKTPFPVFHNTVLSDAGEILLTNVRVRMEKQALCFSAPKGKLGFSQCTVEATDCSDFCYARNILCLDSEIEATTYYSGMSFEGVNPEATDEISVITGTRLTLRALDFARMTEEILRPYWNVMDDTLREEYASFNGYLDAMRSSYERSGASCYGILLSTATFSLEESRVDIRDYAVGILGNGDVLMQLMKGLRLRIEASKIALVLFSNYENAIQNTVSYRSRGAYIGNLNMPTDATNVGAAVYAFTKDGIALKEYTPIDGLTAAIEALDGASTLLIIRTQGSVPGIVWVLVAVGSTILILAAIYGAVMLSGTHRAKGGKSSPSAVEEEAPARSASDASDAEETVSESGEEDVDRPREE